MPVPWTSVRRTDRGASCRCTRPRSGRGRRPRGTRGARLTFGRAARHTRTGGPWPARGASDPRTGGRSGRPDRPPRQEPTVRWGWPWGPSGPSELGVDVVHGVPDGPQLLEVLIVDAEAHRALSELLFEAFHQLDQRQPVGVEVLGERGR